MNHPFFSVGFRTLFPLACIGLRALVRKLAQ